MRAPPPPRTERDDVQRPRAALPVPETLRHAAVRQECLRRRPEFRPGDTPPAAAVRGRLRVCALGRTQAGAVGQPAVQGVRGRFRNSWRASRLVEGRKSVPRRPQARHGKMSQGLRDLKRLDGNGHTFRTGRRSGKIPYELLGVPWPEGLRWWEVLNGSPEQLRDKLSTLKTRV
jgi:hypothetical protein